MVGTNYTDVHVATGFGNHLARPLMREKHRPDMSEEEAVALMHECLKVGAPGRVCVVFFFLGGGGQGWGAGGLECLSASRCTVRWPAAWVGPRPLPPQVDARPAHPREPRPAPQVCYYRDKNSINKFQLAKVTTAGVSIRCGCLAGTRRAVCLAERASSAAAAPAVAAP